VTHPVYAVAGSRLAAAAGEGAVIDGCITIHHQSVDRVGTGLVVTATSTDGIVEALETPPESTGWVLAVQWHPERSASFDPGQQALFDAFAAAVPVTSPVS
jgi:putative glutamine amidotransferase